MTRKEQHKQQKRANKGRSSIAWQSGIICTLIYVGVNSKRRSAFYVSIIEKD
jgi:hypothetical protein